MSTEIATTLLNTLDEAVKRGDAIQVHVLRRTLELLPSRIVEDAVALRLETRHPRRSERE